jgi:CheY-like chemotaxis protein
MTPNSGEHLLVVDDSPTVRKLIELTFRATSWIVDFAASGAEAVHIARTRNPRLILLDVVLPDMPALSVCDQLSRDAKTEHIPIVLMSAKEESVRRQFSQHASVVDFIQKPFSREELASRVEAALAKKKESSKNDRLTVMSGRWPTTAVCSMIGVSARTGELLFRTERGSVLVYWVSGEIVFVSSFDPQDYAEWARPNDDTLTADVFELAEDLQRETAKPVPVTYAEHGMLSKNCDLSRVLVAVGRKLLSDVLNAGELEFEWRELEQLPAYVVTHGRKLPISPKVIAFGPEHTWPSAQDVFRHAPTLSANIEDLVLTVRERRVLGLIDGSSPLQKVAAHAGLDPRYVRQIACSFTTLGLIEPAKMIENNRKEN